MAVVTILVLAGIAIWADLKWGPDSYLWHDTTSNDKKRGYK